ncbi:MAG: 5-formyltetrahydrofolate cyclo-ligase [Hyphomicrobiales bacterium]|jgi:5-formyltetrahydrofolate cyclo-ligase|nr:5-formyltetrahydrofolate cyclo-ligase [Hyphomicrobiales bacterium]
MTSPGHGPLSQLTKVELRAQALARRDALAPDARSQAAALIAARIAALPLPEGPVAAYWPIRSEADPRPAAALLRARGCAILLPCVMADRLVFRLWNEDDALAKGELGMMEPSPDARALAPATLLVPLAAFDRRGHRIGYGKGFYDRALGALGLVTTLGIAFATQEISLIPDEPHDHPLDFVVTEQETIDTRVTRGS